MAAISWLAGSSTLLRLTSVYQRLQDLNVQYEAKRNEQATQEDIRRQCQELLAYRVSVNEEEAIAKRQDELHAASARVRLSVHLLPTVEALLSTLHSLPLKQLPGSLCSVNRP